MEGSRATDKNLQLKLGSVRGMENVFCSYHVNTNLKNNSDCLFGPTIGQWQKSPSNGSSASHPEGFLVSCVELRMSVFFKMAGG